MTVELQKELAQRMGILTGKPPTSGLHIFPLMHTTKQIGDKEVTVISDQGGKSNGAKDAAAKPRLRLQDPSVSGNELKTNASSIRSLYEPIYSEIGFPFSAIRLSESGSRITH